MPAEEEAARFSAGARGPRLRVALRGVSGGWVGGCRRVLRGRTGVRGGDMIGGSVLRVETAGAPVSPRMSAPRPLDRRRARGRARGILSLGREGVLSFLGWSRGEVLGVDSKVTVDMVKAGGHCRGATGLLSLGRVHCAGQSKMKLSCRDLGVSKAWADEALGKRQRRE